jgi:cytochrome c oxidase subunit 3
MATLTPTVKVRKPQSGGQGGSPIIPFPGNGGGGGGDHDHYPNFGEQLRRYRLGLAVGLAAVVMLFVSLTSAYIVRQGLGQWDAAANRYVTDWVPLRLPVGLLAVNTLILLLSSYTIEKARRTALRRLALAPVMELPGISLGREQRVPWLPLTVALGVAFLGGQWLAWQRLAQQGFFLASTPSSSFFYVLTAMHALHLGGGIVALAYAAVITSYGGRALERRRIVVDITAWYWHFMALLWLYVFALLRFAS